MESLKPSTFSHSNHINDPSRRKSSVRTINSAVFWHLCMMPPNGTLLVSVGTSSFCAMEICLIYICQYLYELNVIGTDETYFMDTPFIFKACKCMTMVNRIM